MVATLTPAAHQTHAAVKPHASGHVIHHKTHGTTQPVPETPTQAKGQNRVLVVLMRRLGASKTFGENMIFMLNRAGASSASVPSTLRSSSSFPAGPQKTRRKTFACSFSSLKSFTFSSRPRARPSTFTQMTSRSSSTSLFARCRTCQRNQSR